MDDMRAFQILTAARLACGDNPPDDIVAAWKSAAAALGKARGVALLEAWGSAARAKLARGWPREGPGSAPALTTAGDAVMLGERRLGRIAYAFRAVSPTEIQVRLAYDTLVTRFLEYLCAADGLHAAVLAEGPQGAQIFLPAPEERTVEDLWERFLDDENDGLFSRRSLQNSFVDIVNTMQLSARGIGTPQIAIAHPRQRDMLCGWMLANLRYQKWSMIDNHIERIDACEKAIQEAGGKDAKAAREIADRSARLESNRAKYGAIFDRALNEVMPETQPSVREWTGRWQPGGGNSVYTRTGMSQFATDPGKLNGVLNKVSELLAMTGSDMVRIEPLLSELTAEPEVQGAGDDDTKTCYACGRAIPRGKGIDATRLVLGKPERRRQSSAASNSPKVCSQCAAVATLSPFKDADGVMIVEWRPTNGDGAADPQALAEMLTFAHMRIRAGRLTLIGIEETYGRGSDEKPLSARFGTKPYAMLKLAEIRPRAVLRDGGLEPFLHVGRDTMRLEIRHIEMLADLLDLLWMETLGELGRVPTGLMKQIEAAVDAVLRDSPHQAVYRVVRMGVRGGEAAFQERRDALIRHFIGRMESMEQSKDVAKLYRDVAALTGLLAPFIEAVENEIGERMANRPEADVVAAKRIAVTKLIDDADNQNAFRSRAATHMKWDTVVQWRNTRRADRDFETEQCHELLGRIGKDMAAREAEAATAMSKDDVGWALYTDDITNAFQAVLERETNASGQARGTLFRELKHSLVARFHKYYLKPTSEDK